MGVPRVEQSLRLGNLSVLKRMRPFAINNLLVRMKSDCADPHVMGLGMNKAHLCLSVLLHLVIVTKHGYGDVYPPDLI